MTEQEARRRFGTQLWRLVKRTHDLVRVESGDTPDRHLPFPVRLVTTWEVRTLSGDAALRVELRSHAAGHVADVFVRVWLTDTWAWAVRGGVSFRDGAPPDGVWRLVADEIGLEYLGAA